MVAPRPHVLAVRHSPSASLTATAATSSYGGMHVGLAAPCHQEKLVVRAKGPVVNYIPRGQPAH